MRSGAFMFYSLRCAVFVLILGLLNAYSEENRGAADLDQVQLKNIPLHFESVPLTNVLGRIGVSVKDGFVLFGVEVTVQRGQEPLVTADITGGATLRKALTTVVQAIPGYRFEAVAPHLINVLPIGAENDGDDLLNVQLSNFHLVNVSGGGFLGNPVRFLPELKAALTRAQQHGCEIGPGFSDKAPGITIQATRVTVRQALNLVSQASIASAEHGTGYAFGWVYLREEFPSDSNPANSWRVHDVWDPARHQK